MKFRLQEIQKTLGPGILFASSAIGVSHLVQATRAGAEYGYSLLWAIIIANLLKYPFFEFGSRYTVYSGKSLLEGYHGLGKWALWGYLGITLLTMFTVVAAVTYVAAGLFNNLLGLTWGIDVTSLILFVVCILILLRNSFKLLNQIIQVIAALLVVSTLVCFVAILINGRLVANIPNQPLEIFSEENGPVFLIALMGWMPTAVDLSVWNSLWTKEKMKGERSLVPKQVIREFNFGYLLSALLSVVFLLLGAYALYGNGEEFASSALTFANQLISIYTQSMGGWSYYIIALAAFSIMFSTTLTVFDGYSRAMGSTFGLLVPSNRIKKWIWLLVIGIISFVIIRFFLSRMRDLINLATIASFVVAPLIAVLNFTLVRQLNKKGKGTLPKYLEVLSVIGIGYLVIFTLWYAWVA